MRFKAYKHSTGAYRIAVSPYIKYDDFRAYTTLGIFARYKIQLDGTAKLIWEENNEDLKMETVNIKIDGSTVPATGESGFEVKHYKTTSENYKMY